MDSEFRSWKVAGLAGVAFLWDRGSISYPHHVHDGFNVDLVQSGLMEYRVGARKFVAHHGSIMLIPPHEVHVGKSINRQPVLLRTLFMSDSFLLQAVSELGVKRFDPHFRPIVQDHHVSLEVGLIHRIAENRADTLEIETRLLDAVSSLFLNHFSFYWKDSYREHRAVNTIREYLLAHFDENVSLRRLADLVQLNRSYLVRVFTSQVGLSPYQYLTEIRMAKARSLLAEGMSPAEVAVTVGLCDQSHLTRLFKRSTGRTPAVFARKPILNGT